MGSLQTSQIISGSVGALPGATDGYFGAAIASVIAISGNSVIPIGMYAVVVDVSGQIEVQTAAGTWVALAPIASGGFVFSDGANVRVLNTSATLTSALTLLPKA